MNELELIIKYKMNELEAKAFKICLMWQDLCKREFPNEHHIKINLNKDPRKTTIFKYCYKLVRETKGLLADDKEYYLYITAQLQVMKLMKEGKIHALVEPQILVGDKAWKRWKIWKRKYDKKLKQILTCNELSVGPSESKIKIELKKSLEFLKKHDCANLEKVDINTLKRWISNFQISPYYILLYPKFDQIINKLDDFDQKLYRPFLTPEIEKFFKEDLFEK